MWISKFRRFKSSNHEDYLYGNMPRDRTLQIQSYQSDKASPFSSHNTLAYFQTTCSETSDAMDRTVYIYLLNGYGIFLSVIFLVFRPKYNRSESAVATNQVLPESLKTVSTNQWGHLFRQTSDVITCKKILTRKNWDSIIYINIYFLYSN